MWGIRMSKTILSRAALVLFAMSPLWGQQHDPKSDTPKMTASEMHDMPGMGNDGSTHAMQSMEGHHMDMGPHMKMTALRTPQPGDTEKAQKVVEVARGVMEKYKDYHVALDENFKIFHPE